jgi:hypothetical protein
MKLQLTYLLIILPCLLAVVDAFSFRELYERFAGGENFSLSQRSVPNASATLKVKNTRFGLREQAIVTNAGEFELFNLIITPLCHV